MPKKESKEEKVDMKTGQTATLPKYSKEFSAEQEVIVGKQLEDYLRKRELLDPIVKAVSVDNIKDPIVYRRVFNAIYEFCEMNGISLEDPPIKPVYNTSEEQQAIRIKLESHWNRRGLFKIHEDAVSVANIKDPIRCVIL